LKSGGKNPHKKKIMGKWILNGFGEKSQAFSSPPEGKIQGGRGLTIRGRGMEPLRRVKMHCFAVCPGGIKKGNPKKKKLGT